MSGDKPASAQASIRLHLIVGLTVVVLLAGGLGGWASTAEISGALIAPGLIVVESSVKKVQHPTGGVVGELRAHDGDLVKAGDVVVRLDDTVTKANLAIVTKNLDGMLARAARLQAEQQGLDKVVFPASLLARTNDPDVKDVMASEAKLFEVRTTGRVGQKQQLRERILQTALDHAFQRTRAIDRIVAGIGEPGSRPVVELDGHLAVCQQLLQPLQLDVHDAAHLLEIGRAHV